MSALRSLDTRLEALRPRRLRRDERLLDADREAFEEAVVLAEFGLEVVDDSDDDFAF